jgi:hypothetical protein
MSFYSALQLYRRTEPPRIANASFAQFTPLSST